MEKGALAPPSTITAATAYDYAGGGGGFSGEQTCRDFHRGACIRSDCRFKHVGGGGAPRSPDRRRSPPR